MKVIALLKDIRFHEKDPNAEPLFVSDEARVLRFTLRPGQVVREHHAPHSPVIVTVLKGEVCLRAAMAWNKSMARTIY